jgi:hypothetical protein
MRVTSLSFKPDWRERLRLALESGKVALGKEFELDVTHGDECVCVVKDETTDKCTCIPKMILRTHSKQVFLITTEGRVERET